MIIWYKAWAVIAFILAVIYSWIGDIERVTFCVVVIHLLLAQAWRMEDKH